MIYDKGEYKSWIDGRVTKEYKLWKGMFERCQKLAAYQDCSVDQSWDSFQSFASWCNKQTGFGVPGFELDKDVLVPGNKVYGPNTCCFIPSEINKFLTHKKSTKGIYPVGVTFDSKANKYCAQITISGRAKWLGRFDTPESAYETYAAAKFDTILTLAAKYRYLVDDVVYKSLISADKFLLRL